MEDLGLTLDHRLNFRQTATELRARAQLATPAVREMVARDSGCSQRTALRLYGASAVGQGYQMLQPKTAQTPSQTRPNIAQQRNNPARFEEKVAQIFGTH